MSELMLINPRGRRRHTKKRTHRARARTHHKRKTHRRRRNPWPGQSRRHAAAARKGWRHRSHRRRYRNPRGRRAGGLVQGTILPSVTAAAGAIGIDLLLGYLPLPDTMKTGPMRWLVKGAAAIGAGMLLEKMKVVKPSTAQMFVTGALTVTMYDAGKSMVNRFAPTIGARMAGLGMYEDESMMGLGYAGAGYTGLDEGDMSGLGYYPDEMQGLNAGDDIEAFDL